MNIQHCAVIRSEEECLKFRFIIAKCSQEKLPYKFREKEGVFNPHTQYATIKLKQFSMVGEVGPQGTEIRYTALKFYKQIPKTVSVEFKFVVVCNHEPILKVLTHVTFATNYSYCFWNPFQYTKKEHIKWTRDEETQCVVFDGDVIILELPQAIEHWRFVPRTYPQVYTCWNSQV